jgi:nitroimidazol reductase NimA-like FMN-containing flavoprotein (pyridoxamine 5'-phosphate oxidase superfamily)
MLGQLTSKQVERMLLTEVVGRLGCQGRTRSYVVPVTYAYDGEAVYARSADGLKLEMMRANPEVCFEVDHVEDLRNWQSVIAWGTFEELAGAEAEEAAHFLERRLHPRSMSDTFASHHAGGSSSTRADDVVRATVYRIKLLEKTGRFEREGAGPGTSLDGGRPLRPAAPARPSAPS